MKRIICHWTAGRYNVSALDKKHYHFVFDGDGNEVKGDHPVKANKSPIRGSYAAHTRNANSDSIGLSMACMWNAKENGPYGSYPVTFAQFDAMAKKAAALCKEYSIKVTPETVLWHAEVQANLHIAQRGKWDATVLPFNGLKGRKECGDFLRQRVSFYMGAVPGEKPAIFPSPKPSQPLPDAPGIVRRGAKGGAVISIQERLRAHGFWVDIDGDFGPMTDKAVRAFQKAKGLVPDGIVGPRTLAALESPVARQNAIAATTKGASAMSDTKSMFASKGIWGGLIALAGALAPFAGVADSELSSIVAAAGAVLAIFGRWTAKARIG